MNDSASRKKIRLGEVASALDAEPKNIRNWVGGGRFDLLQDENRAPQKWREFSYFDVAHLSIAQEAIKFGFLVDEAHDFAGATLLKVLGPLANSRSLARMPAAALAALMRGKSLHLLKLSNGETRAIIAPGEHDDLLPHAPSALRINLEMVVFSAFTELAEMGHDAFESSRPREYTAEEAAELERNYEKFLTENPDFAKWEDGVQQEAAQRRETVGNHSAGASAPASLKDECNAQEV